jgi:membrane associated rhomboid family serine protease
VIIACTLVFLAQLAGGPQSRMTEEFGFVPARVTQPGKELVVELSGMVMTEQGPRKVTQSYELAPPAVSVPLTFITCIFLHGGWMHFLGNMWFLWIFGDNVEDRLGHFAFAILYAATGVLASVSHLFSDPTSTIPTIGASGAIAGVMGAYAILYPHARVMAVIPIVIFLHMVVLPAPVFLGFWFLMQLWQGGMSSLGGVSEGVAWWAHVGGFVAGALAAIFVNQIGWSSDPVTERRR